MKKIYFLFLIHCQYSLFFPDQYMSKDLSAFIFHFKQLQYLQAVYSSTHTLSQTRARTQILLSGIY